MSLRYMVTNCKKTQNKTKKQNQTRTRYFLLQLRWAIDRVHCNCDIWTDLTGSVIVCLTNFGSCL